MWWIIIPSIVLGFIIYLLHAPFFVEIDSTKGFLKFRFHKLASADLLFKENSIFLRLKIIWWHKEYDLLNSPLQNKGPKKVKKRNAPGKRVKRMPERILSMLRSCKVKTFFITIDTGNMPENGILYPWFYLLGRYTRKEISINFWGQNEIIITINNSMARMIWAFIKLS